MLSYLLPIISVLAVSCVHTQLPDIEEPEMEEVPADTVMTHLKIRRMADWCGTDRLDILVYEAGGMQGLELHLETDGEEDALDIRSSAGDKECVIIANSTRNLDLKIMERFDTMQSLAFTFEDEDIKRPVMVGRVRFTAGDVAEVLLEPFLCRVILEEVSNAMEGWMLMEEPEVYLSDINPEVGILQEKDFRPSATREEGPASALPCDVGFFSQHPGIVLHCYPNDTPERVLGGCRSMLGFRCRVEGREYTESVALPPMGKNGTAMVKVDMDEGRNITIRISTSP